MNQARRYGSFGIRCWCPMMDSRNHIYSASISTFHKVLVARPQLQVCTYFDRTVRSDQANATSRYAVRRRPWEHRLARLSVLDHRY